jgi:hypothetical protein
MAKYRMRDLINALDTIITEVTISKPKYGPGTQFSVSAGSEAGKKLLALLQQQGFDATPPLTRQDADEMSEEDILNLPTVTYSKGGDGYVFSNNRGQSVLITGSASTIGSALNAYTGATADAEGGKIANRGETAEGILGAAMFAKFTKRESGEDIGTVTPQDIGNVLDSLKQTGEDQYQVEVEDFDNEHADVISFVLRLKSVPYNDLMDPEKRPLLANEFSSAAAYVNSSDAERYSKYFYINGRSDQIVIMADGVTGEKEQKTDVWVYVTDEDGQQRKLRLNTSLKVGGVKQFGQVGGESEQTQETLWNYFGINVGPALSKFTKARKSNSPTATRDAFKQMYQYAANQLNQKLEKASPKDEANILDSIATGITHFATLGDPNVELVDFSDGGFKILRFNKLIEKLKTVDLDATYADSKTQKNGPDREIWPEVQIHERGDPKNKLLTIRMKVENKPKGGIYVRNYIEKGPLLEKLTEYRKASWDRAPAATGAQELDAVTSTPRLTGPGAKAARVKHEPRMDKATLGRTYKG